MSLRTEFDNGDKSDFMEIKGRRMRQKKAKPKSKTIPDDDDNYIIMGPPPPKVSSSSNARF